MSSINEYLSDLRRAGGMFDGYRVDRSESLRILRVILRFGPTQDALRRSLVLGVVHRNLVAKFARPDIEVRVEAATRPLWMIKRRLRR